MLCTQDAEIEDALSVCARQVEKSETNMFRNELEIHIPTDEEEAAIQEDIALDPDAPELTAEDWARARPAIEVAPHLVERHRRARAEGKNIPMIEHVSIPLDATLVRRLKKADPNWKPASTTSSAKPSSPPDPIPIRTYLSQFPLGEG